MSQAMDGNNWNICIYTKDFQPIIDCRIEYPVLHKDWFVRI